MDKNALINKNTANNGEPAVGKTFFPDVSLKELMAMPDVQEAVRRHISVPNPVIPKKVRNPFKNGETGITTQKVESVSGTSLMDIVNVSFTLVGTGINPTDAINKPFRIVDYAFALDANMAGGKFNGYSAKGLKLLVTKIEEVKGGGQDGNQKNDNA